MSANLLQLNCCGLNELYGIASLNDKEPLGILYPVLIHYARNGKTPPRAFFLFTAARPSGRTDLGLYGRPLADAIRRENLGQVTETDWVLNPNSGNEIKLFTWRLDHVNLLRWMMKTFPEFGKGVQQPTLGTIVNVAQPIPSNAGGFAAPF